MAHMGARLSRDTRGCHGRIREELAAGVKESPGVPGLQGGENEECA